MVAGAVLQGADDLAVVVDAICKCCLAVHGIVDSGEDTAAIEEGVRAGGVVVLPDDLAQIVDAKCLGAIGGQGIVEGGEVPLLLRRKPCSLVLVK